MLGASGVLVACTVFSWLFIHRPDLPDPPTPTVSVDCVLESQVAAWLDANANGRRDPSETALAGVRFELDDVSHGDKNIAEVSISASDGTAVVSKFLPGCPESKFEVRAVPPLGFKFTTDPSVPATEHVQFGLVGSGQPHPMGRATPPPRA